MIFVRNKPLTREIDPMRKQNTRRRRGGFTLMEIMLVLAILVVLASASGLAYQAIRKRAMISTAKDGIRTMEMAVGGYLSDNNELPASLDVLFVPKGQQGETYLDAPPLDPWGMPYNFVPGTAEDFEITSNGPDKVQGGADDVFSAKSQHNVKQ
jgi:general secretion pathway protein G